MAGERCEGRKSAASEAIRLSISPSDAARAAGWCDVSALCGERAPFTVMRVNLKGRDPWDKWPFAVYRMVMPSCLKTATMNTFSEQKEKKNVREDPVQSCETCETEMFALFSDLTKKKNTAKNNGYMFMQFLLFCFVRSLIYLCWHLHQTPEVWSIQATRAQ